MTILPPLSGLSSGFRPQNRPYSDAWLRPLRSSPESRSAGFFIAAGVALCGTFLCPKVGVRRNPPLPPVGSPAAQLARPALINQSRISFLFLPVQQNPQLAFPTLGWRSVNPEAERMIMIWRPSFFTTLRTTHRAVPAVRRNPDATAFTSILHAGSFSRIACPWSFDVPQELEDAQFRKLDPPTLAKCINTVWPQLGPIVRHHPGTHRQRFVASYRHDDAKEAPVGRQPQGRIRPCNFAGALTAAFDGRQAARWLAMGADSVSISIPCCAMHNRLTTLIVATNRSL